MRQIIFILAIAALVPTFFQSAVAAQDEWANAADAAAFGLSKVSLIQAMAVAQDQSGGRAVHARFDGSAHVFWVTIFVKGRIHDLAIDDNAGRVTATRPPELISSLEPAARIDLNRIATAKFGLSDAIAVSNERGGNALAVGGEWHRHELLYRIDTVNDGRLATILVDPVVRKVIWLPLQ
jgi:hypothetical protein